LSDDQTVTHRAVARLPLAVLEVKVLAGPDAPLEHVAQADTVTVGTAPGNDLLLSDETVSRYHAELKIQGSRVLVKDLGSRNGTMLAGGVVVREASVEPGTVLSLGRTQLRVDDGGTVSTELYEDDALGRVRGRASEMRRLMAKIEKSAKSDAPILLLGETGSGKEVIANAIHEHSKRREQVFETVDCGSLLPTLVASELFGHEKGAFTGADRQHIGAFERAYGGTLFLDEIGELPSSLQPYLLGALERRSFKRVGGNKQIPVDVRIVCATNRDLREEVNKGLFRQDLYFRIAVVTLNIPPLRDRAGDIPLLVEHFLREAGYDGELDTIVSPSVMSMLQTHRWPGNVRELRNFVEATLAMGEAPPLAAEESAGQPASFLTVPIEELMKRPYADARGQLLQDFEAVYLRALLERTSGNVASAAREAKMARSYLNEMLRRHRLR
jgi:DNA-binding NtrC family response regulator